jgi:hypothetical protein
VIQIVLPNLKANIGAPLQLVIQIVFPNLKATSGTCCIIVYVPCSIPSNHNDTKTALLQEALTLALLHAAKILFRIVAKFFGLNITHKMITTPDHDLLSGEMYSLSLVVFVPAHSEESSYKLTTYKTYEDIMSTTVTLKC